MPSAGPTLCPNCGHTLAAHGASSLRPPGVEPPRIAWCCADRRCDCDRYPAEKRKEITLGELDRLLRAAGEYDRTS